MFQQGNTNSEVVQDQWVLEEVFNEKQIDD